jgi:hypothetical protein
MLLALMAVLGPRAVQLTQPPALAAAHVWRISTRDFAAIDAYVTTQMKHTRILGLALAIV